MKELQVSVEMGDDLDDEQNYDVLCEENYTLNFNYYDDNPSFDEPEVNQDEFEDLGWGLEPKITRSDN